jgi:peptidoglycan hydrolase-like protein with peptidoglycan-binding domain
VLRKGSEDVATVSRLQEMLNVFVGHAEEGGHAHPIAVDGEFGPQTEQAVCTFQRADAADLEVDGIVGPKPGRSCSLSGSPPPAPPDRHPTQIVITPQVAARVFDESSKRVRQRG